MLAAGRRRRRRPPGTAGAVRLSRWRSRTRCSALDSVPTLPGRGPAGPRRREDWAHDRPATPRDPRRHRRPARAASPTRRCNPPVMFASTYVGSHDTRTARFGYGRVRQPDLAGAGGRDRGPGGRPGPDLRLRDGRRARRARAARPGSTVVLPDNCYLGVAASVDARAARTAGRCAGSTSPTPTPCWPPPRAPTWSGSSRRPTRLIEVADLPAIGAALPGRVRLVVDNTFATPLLQQPLALGADIVLHSATKFIAGHSDALLGALVVGRTPTPSPRSTRSGTTCGAAPGTMEAYLALRGLRTLPLRLARAQANAAGAGRSGWPRTRPSARPLPRSARRPRPRARRPDDGRLRLADLGRAGRRPDRRRLRRRRRLWVFATSLGGVESSSSAAAAGPASCRSSPRAWSGCPSASSTSRTSGPTSPRPSTRQRQRRALSSARVCGGGTSGR